MRASYTRQMRPLRQPKIRARTYLESRDGEPVNIGNAIEPNRFCAHEATKAQCEITRCGARGDYDIWLLRQEDPCQLGSCFDQSKFGGKVRVGNGPEFVPVDLQSIGFVRGDESHVTILERGTDAKQLDQ